ncbi:MAG: sortase [Chloroflexi bacterium]|nr:MAG: sortase [Chloroflexota bacterium]
MGKMRDRRAVDELSIEELERILAIRKRELRQKRLDRYVREGRRIPADAPIDQEPEPLLESVVVPQQHEAAQDLPPVEPPVTYDLTGDIPRFEDEFEEELAHHRQDRLRSERPARRTEAGDGRSRRRAVWDHVLLAVEVLGVVGIVGVLIVGGYLVINEQDKIDALDQKSAEMQRDADAMRATPTPAPILSLRLSDYVLPTGHYSPDQTGGEAAFNLDELPESIRPMALAQILAPQAERVAPQPSSPNRIVIATDKVSVDASIYGGDDWAQLQKGVGHLAGSANPGEDANMVLAAHNDIFGEIFRDIQYLTPGDEIRVQARDGRWYTYVVYNKEIVDPTDVWVLERGREPIVTLITCHPYRVDTQRMIVFARLSEDESS